jgi:hypothetical protein
MDKDAKHLANSYLKILESTNISNNMTQGTSTKYYPTIQDVDEEELSLTEKDKILKKLEPAFSNIKSLIDSCNKNCTLKIVSELIDSLDRPDFRTDINSLRDKLQESNVETGANSRLSYS